ncbi:MAG: DNA mismatch repair protein MutS, partial [Clostridiales bacterium]|nr:DNA mismatch repair protein MutS [Clostridiales bacterium]
MSETKRKNKPAEKLTRSKISIGDLTPMMRQYFAVKAQYEDCILMYRLGDFYEMFYDDAETASRELEIALTGRACGLEQRAPMCGIPYHSYEGYVAKLISKGYKVAICEQTEDPATAKGIVKREVVRIITPGTVTESSMLTEGINNYLCSIHVSGEKAGLCFCDVSTGEVHVTTAIKTDHVLIGETERFMPTELIISDSLFDSKSFRAKLSEINDALVNRESDYECGEEEARELVSRHFGSSKDILSMDEARAALGVMLKYLHVTQKNTLEHVNRLEIYDSESYMLLDRTARRNLELFETLHTKEKKGSLLWVLDRTKTAMGARLLRKYIERPLLNPVAIGRRQNGVRALYGSPIALSDTEEMLGGIFDLERLSGKIAIGSVTPRELVSFSSSLGKLPELKNIIKPLESSVISDICRDMDELEDVRKLIGESIKENPGFLLTEGNIIRDGYSPELDELRDIMSGGRNVIASVETREREKTGIKTLKVGYNRVFGYYIEVSKANQGSVPEHYIRKQTLSAAERYITPELKELESTVLGAKDRITSLEQELYCDIRQKVASHIKRIQLTASAVARLDVLVSLARAAMENNYVCPQVDYSSSIEIYDGRHPVVEKMPGNPGFVPNDTNLSNDKTRVMIITGPNMAGKSTYMRQVAIITLMGQIGSFVPAAEARIGVVDRIFTRIGASDDLAGGKSTFLVEMSEVAEIIEEATDRSLLVLDEIGRGTSTYDGMAIARAVLEYVVNKLGAKTMFATHYHELTILADELPNVANFNSAVRRHGE